jgi:hypothetical protein
LSLAAVLREEIDRRTRPGQACTSLVAHRVLDGAVFGPGNVAMLNRRDTESGADLRSGVYQRSRYGTGRYAPSTAS